MKNISILKEKPLYLSKITETIFLLYRSLHKEKKKIKNLQIKQDNSLFISFFEEKIKKEKGLTLLFIITLFRDISNLVFVGFTIITLIFIICNSLLIIFSLNITKYSKSWSDSYSNLFHWNEFFSNYEITPKKKELNLLEKDFQQFEIKKSNQSIKCLLCGKYNDPNSNYCESCGNKLEKKKGDKK